MKKLLVMILVLVSALSLYADDLTSNTVEISVSGRVNAKMDFSVVESDQSGLALKNVEGKQFALATFNLSENSTNSSAKLSIVPGNGDAVFLLRAKNSDAVYPFEIAIISYNHEGLVSGIQQTSGLNILNLISDSPNALLGGIYVCFPFGRPEGFGEDEDEEYTATIYIQFETT
ncbi:MAG: hypothetical protein J5785_04675 [Spirochaetales bacterium]|nr:hypothetical protein [Spirochaetales bacterium]